MTIDEEFMNVEGLSEFNQTQPGVFHAFHWGQSIPKDFVKALVREAETNPNRKARLCLHPSPKEITQITFIALASPYEDRLHIHPHKPEVMIPVSGRAELIVRDELNLNTEIALLDSENFVPVSIESGVLHAIRVLSHSFVFMEIGNGPFNTESTLYI